MIELEGAEVIAAHERTHGTVLQVQRDDGALNLGHLTQSPAVLGHAQAHDMAALDDFRRRFRVAARADSPSGRRVPSEAGTGGHVRP